MAESNIREILSADRAFDRWRRLAPQATDADNSHEPLVIAFERVAFRAGWEAAIQALIDAKLVVDG